MNPENVPTQPTVPEPAPTPTPGIGNAPSYTPPEQPQPAPSEPTPQPSEPQPAPQPAEPQPAPAETEQPQPAPKVQSYDEYLESLIGNIQPPEVPKATEVNGEDPEALNKFFENFGEAIEKRVAAQMQQQEVIRSAEAQAWNDVFTKYPEIKDNQELRDTVHNIRMGAYASGKSLSPVQVADALVGTLHSEYKRGINDQQVQTRVQASQPLNGGGQPVPAPKINLEALQQPGNAGFDSAVNQIQSMIDSNRI